MASHPPTGHRAGLGYAPSNQPSMAMPFFLPGFAPGGPILVSGYMPFVAARAPPPPPSPPPPPPPAYTPAAHVGVSGMVVSAFVQPHHHTASHPPPPPPPPPPAYEFKPQKAHSHPGINFLYPKSHCHVHLIKNTSFDGLQNNVFNFSMHKTPCTMSIREFIEQVGGGHFSFVTEVFQRGNGIWAKGCTVYYGEERARLPVQTLGWGAKRGTKKGNPVWVILG